MSDGVEAMTGAIRVLLIEDSATDARIAAELLAARPDGEQD